MIVGSRAKLVRQTQFVSRDAASLIEVVRIEMERNAKQSQDTNLHSSFNAFPDGPSQSVETLADRQAHR